MFYVANAQVILLTAGYLYRCNSDELTSITRSGSYLSAISSRLAASSPRARFIGMVVAMALSRLTDAPDKAMNFELEAMESDEAIWYMDLPKIDDQVGTIRDLVALNKDTPGFGGSTKSSHSKPGDKRKSKRNNQNTSKIVSIEEISDESENDDLLPYEKPDSDASDSEEDATLVQRSKPSAPV